MKGINKEINQKELSGKLQTVDRYFRFNEKENKLDIVVYNAGDGYGNAIVDESMSAQRIWRSIEKKVWVATKKKNGLTDKQQYTNILKLIAHASKFVEDEIKIEKEDGDLFVIVIGYDPRGGHTWRINVNKEGKEWIEKGIAMGKGYDY